MQIENELDVRLEADLMEILRLKPAQIKKMTFTEDEIRGIVRTYYDLQLHRTRTMNQTRIYNETERPHMLVAFIGNEMKRLEDNCKAALEAYSNTQGIGLWAKSIHGIGPCIASGLMAYIDIEKAPVVSHIWRYAGLDPTVEWLGKEKIEKIFTEIVPKGKADIEQAAKIAAALNRNPSLLIPRLVNDIERIKVTREWDDEADEERETKELVKRPITRADQIALLSMPPYNLTLKTLCWKIGDQFRRRYKHPDDVYGKIYIIRKVYEQEKNEKGEYAKEAEKKLAKCKFSNKEVEAVYKSGKLPPGHIDARAMRYAVKIFLSHWHAVAYELHYKEKPPKPFAIGILGHAHEIPIPNWPMIIE